MNQKFKIGVIIEGKKVSNWKLATITNLQSQNTIQLDFIYLNLKKNNATKYYSPFFYLIKLLYKAVLKLENKLFSEIGPNAFNKTEINTTASTEQEIYINHPENIAKCIKSNSYDVLLNFSNHTFNEECLKAPRFGIWEVFSGHNTLSNIFIGLKEVFFGESIYQISLQKLVANSKPNRVIYTSYSQVDKINILRSKNQAFWKSPEIILRKIIEAQSTDSLVFGSIREPVFKNNEINNSFIIIFFKLLYNLPWRYFKYLVSQVKKRFIFDQWILMYQFGVNFNHDFSFNDFKKIIPPKDRIWADPFVIKKDEKYHIFIEELLFKEGKGFISHFTMDYNGNYTTPVKIIENEYHMSYPFLIEDDGALYMIPETNQNNTIQIYRCVDFPHKWELVMNLMENVEAVDTTIYYKDNKYWMFTNIRRNNGIAFEDELFIYSSDILLSKDWILHPKSPVVSDVRTARPAGNIFKINDSLFRPSQNSTYHYGYGLNIFEIVTLNEKEYEEKLIKAVVPNWDNKIVSIHTFNQEAGFSIIDAEQRRKRV